MSAIQVWVGVYYKGDSLRSPAGTFTSAEGAAAMVESGLAHWNKSGKSIMLIKTKEEMYRPDLSLTMGPDVSERAADNQERYQILVASWQPGAQVSKVRPGDWMKTAA